MLHESCNQMKESEPNMKRRNVKLRSRTTDIGCSDDLPVLSAGEERNKSHTGQLFWQLSKPF